MAFIHVQGPGQTEGYPKLASTAIAVGSILGLKAGYVCQTTKETVRVVGISAKKVASTDDDFAQNTAIPVILPQDDDVFEADVSGTATQANVGKQYDLTQVAGGTAQSVNLSATTYKVVTVVGFISASKVLVKINSNLVYANKDN